MNQSSKINKQDIFKLWSRKLKFLKQISFEVQEKPQTLESEDNNFDSAYLQLNNLLDAELDKRFLTFDRLPDSIILGTLIDMSGTLLEIDNFFTDEELQVMKAYIY
jgi:phage-related protein